MPASRHLRNSLARNILPLFILAVVGGCSSGTSGTSGTSDHKMHQSNNGEPVNYVVYDDTFASAGMPDATFIKTLGAQGVKHVINIAPPASNGSLENEASLVIAADMSYLNIAVDWNAPTQDDVEQFLDYMKARAGQKVFLHCHMNMRATAFAMLHRVINENMDPGIALQDMHHVWKPNRTWAELMNTTFTRHNIDFRVAVPAE